MTTSLDDRIAASLADADAKIDDIAALLVEAGAAASAATEIAEKARAEALDPLLTGDALADARRMSDEANFRRDRLSVAVDRLRASLEKAKAREQEHQRRVAYEAAMDERDQLGAKLDGLVPALIEFGSLMNRLVGFQAVARRLNADPPAGADWVHSFMDWPLGSTAPPMVRLLQDLAIQDVFRELARSTSPTPTMVSTGRKGKAKAA